MAVLIGDITPTTTVTDNATLNLSFAFGIEPLTVGGSTFVYAAGFSDNGISGFELADDGSLTNTTNVTDNATLEIGGAVNFTSATAGGNTYLYVSGFSDDGLSAFRVNADGTLTNIQNVADSATLQLNTPEGRMTTATVGATSFMIASGQDDNGFSVFRINANGTLTNTDNRTDAGLQEIAGALDVASATVGGNTFIFVAGQADDGVSVYGLSAAGTTTNVANVSDNATLQLDGATGLATAEVNGTTFLVVSGQVDSGLSVFSVSNTGQLTNEFNVSDSAALGLAGVQGVSTFELDGETFVVASGRNDSALTIFHLGATGTLTDVTTLFDDAATATGGTAYNNFANVGGTPMLIGTGVNDNGLTVFDIGSGDDALNGTTSADLLLGLGGEDNLSGKAGNDEVRGGDDADNLDGGIGNDTMSGGRQADILLGWKGKDIMFGDGGNDDFVYTKLNQSGTTNATRDRIQDFKGQDDIDLSAIDAVKGLPGDQDFELDKDGIFVAGEIRVRDVAAGKIIEVNVDGDNKAEMSILLEDYNGPINHSDFIF